MVAGLIAALSVGAVGAAEASSRTTHLVSSSKSVHLVSKGKSTHVVSTLKPTIVGVDPDVAVLAKLVAAGTITQAQSDAVLAALQAARPTRPVIGGSGGDDNGLEAGHGPLGMSLGADVTVITSTLGITAAQLQTDLAAGQSLATIAGAKTAALITALVASETTKINAAVTGGSLTQAQATTLIAGLTASVTAIVNATPGVGGHGHMGMGGMMGNGNNDDSGVPSTTGSN